MYPNGDAASATPRLLCSVPDGTSPSNQPLATFRARGPTIDRERSQCVAELSIAGELDAWAAAVAGERCRDWVADVGDVDVIVDVSAVTFVDSAGTRLIEQLDSMAPRRFVVRAPSRIVRRVFEILNVTIDVEPGATWGRAIPHTGGPRASTPHEPSYDFGRSGPWKDDAPTGNMR